MEAGALLLRLAVLFAAARLAAEVAERMRFPAVLAEIGAGVVLGPSLFGLVANEEPLSFLGELGAILLLLEVGLHIDLDDLRRVGRSAMQVAVIGIAAPLAGGFAAMRMLGMGTEVSLFLAAGITATSVGVTARTFADMRALASVEAQTVLGAAVADDVIGLMILTVVTRLADGNGLQTSSIAGIAAGGLGFLVAAAVIGVALLPPFFARFVRRSKIEGTLIGVAVAFALAVAGLASAARLAPIVGAFVAGVVLSRTRQRDEIRRRLAPVGHLFVPVFFLLIGAETHLRALADTQVLLAAGVLGVVALIGKIASGLGVRSGSGDRMTIGLGMVPRGEVGLVFATLGLAGGVLNTSQHATLLVVVLVSTAVAPLWLRRRFEGRDRAAAVGAADDAPAGGWLDVTDHTVELRGDPSVVVGPHLGLEAALLCADRRPGPRLLDWLSRSGRQSARWDRALVSRFVALLRKGNVRSWRLLEVTGLLDALFPDLATALSERSRDPFDLDPASGLRWTDVEALKDLVEDPDDGAARFWPDVDQDAVLLAAFVQSAFGPEAPAAARDLTTLLPLGEERSALVGFLVAERDLLAAAASRLDMAAEQSVLELAAHIGDRSRCDSLYLVAAARERDITARERLDQLHGLVRDVLSSPGVAEAADLVELRKTEAKRLLPKWVNGVVYDLLDSAPHRYVLTHSPQEIALHVQMLDPPPTRGEIRLRPEPDNESGEWSVFVASLDRPDTLSAITAAFAACDIPVAEASVTTWEGMSADVYRVAASPLTDWDTVRRTAAAALHQPMKNGGATAIEGHLAIDNVASPWHTIVEIRASDRTGLLHRVADVFGRAGITIHHATVRTLNDVAVDRFLVTGRDGHKLDRRDQADLRLSFEGRLRRRWAPTRLWTKVRPLT